MAKLSEQVRGQLRLFAFLLANHTLDIETIGELDYSEIFSEPSILEMAFAIWSNNIEIDDQGNVLNSGYPEKLAAQYIKSFFDQDYKVEPPFESWETELHM